MGKTNLFWPVYKKIEKDVVELSYQIHFDDNQLSIYSVKIAELILRCAVEIEAISKELYFMNGGIGKPANDTLYFDTDCIDLLESKWQLSKKQVIVSSTNFYFQNDENKILRPLNKANKRGSSGADWARAYQSIKHNRTESISKANLKNLVRITAALYLLNLYFRDEVFELAKNNSNNFSYSFSDIFDIKVHKWCGSGYAEYNSYQKRDYFDECVYLIKETDGFRTKHVEYGRLMNNKINELIFDHPNVKQHIIDNLQENGLLKKQEWDNFIKNREYFNCFDMEREYGNMIIQAQNFAAKNLHFDFKNWEYEAVLNKHQAIYNNVGTETNSTVPVFPNK